MQNMLRFIWETRFYSFLIDHKLLNTSTETTNTVVLSSAASFDVETEVECAIQQGLKDGMGENFKF